MLTIHRLKASAAKKYIEEYHDKYYADGIYYGSSLKYLNMESGTKSTEEELVNLFVYGHHPKENFQLGKRKYDEESVSGFDLSLTPVKSISVLWGLGDAKTRKVIEDAHELALKETIKYMENNVAYTRIGANGESVKTNNLLVTAITHYDSRTGDPDLHTHILLANKTYYDDRWLALDGKILYKSIVTMDLYYKSIFEKELTNNLGVRFVEKYNKNQKIPIREIEGISNDIINLFSKRSDDIEKLYSTFIDNYIKIHKRTPTYTVQKQIRERVNALTKDKKNRKESKEEKINKWRIILKEELNLTDKEVDELINKVLNRNAVYTSLDDETIENTAWNTLNEVSTNYAVFNKFLIYNEAFRQINSINIHPDYKTEIVDKIYNSVIEKAFLITDTNSPMPYYSTKSLINKEKYIIRESLKDTKTPILNKLEFNDSDTPHQLSNEQKEWISNISYSTTRITVGIGVAGAGKSTSLLHLANCARAENKNVIALSYTARAAENLGKSINADNYTIHAFLRRINKGEINISKDDILIIDEVSMLNTNLLSDLAKKLNENKIILIGDNKQLQTIEGTSPITYLYNEKNVKIHSMREVHRFKNKEEGLNTLKIRDGNIEALKFYEDNGRIERGDNETIFDMITNNYIQDIKDGKESILLGQSIKEVSELNRIVQSKLTNLEKTAVILSDGHTLHIRDKIVNRQNNRKLGLLNGNTYTVINIRKIHTEYGNEYKVVAVDQFFKKHFIPLSHIEKHCELGYASSINRSQGLTVDTAHTIIRENMSKENFYVCSSRGREENKFYICDPPHKMFDISNVVEKLKSTYEIFCKILSNSETNDEKNFSARQRIGLEISSIKNNLAILRREIPSVTIENNKDIQDTRRLLKQIRSKNNTHRKEDIAELNSLIDRRNNENDNRDVLLINKFINNLINLDRLKNEQKLYITYNPFNELNRINIVEEQKEYTTEKKNDYQKVYDLLVHLTKEITYNQSWRNPDNKELLDIATVFKERGYVFWSMLNKHNLVNKEISDEERENTRNIIEKIYPTTYKEFQKSNNMYESHIVDLAVMLKYDGVNDINIINEKIEDINKNVEKERESYEEGLGE